MDERERAEISQAATVALADFAKRLEPILIEAKLDEDVTVALDKKILDAASAMVLRIEKRVEEICWGPILRSATDVRASPGARPPHMGEPNSTRFRAPRWMQRVASEVNVWLTEIGRLAANLVILALALGLVFGPIILLLVVSAYLAWFADALGGHDLIAFVAFWGFLGAIVWCVSPHLAPRISAALSALVKKDT